MKLAGAATLVTGAASGIGRSTALAASKSGARLVVTDLDGEGVERTAADVRAAGGQVLHAGPADVTDRAAVAALADEVHERHGSLDVVMNVAGISTWGSVETLRPEDWDRMIDVDLRGPIHVISAFVPPMIQAGRGGHLVNVSSAAALFGLPWHAAYSAAKFGLRGVSEVLRFDLRRHGIGVTLVCPGAVDTPLVDTMQIVGVDRSHPTLRKMSERFRRHAATPDDVAAQILRAVERERYLVLTGRDIKLLHVVQRVFPPAYELAMRRMNDTFVRVIARSTRSG
jgi:NAD(P)-dependent dehydrogenase (short-subunit alcohol dehydrogenase family)